jgi:hypothetical protein
MIVHRILKLLLALSDQDLCDLTLLRLIETFLKMPFVGDAIFILFDYIPDGRAGAFFLPYGLETVEHLFWLVYATGLRVAQFGQQFLQVVDVIPPGVSAA